MAISVGKTMEELKIWTKRLGLYDEIVGRGGSRKNGNFKKEDFIIPIREHFLIKRYGSLDKIPKHMMLMLQVKSPMLAMRIDHLNEEDQREIWKSDEWEFEEKLNGARMWAIKTSEGIFFYSRHNSDLDLLPIEYTDNILLPENFDLDPIADEFIIDTEITSDNNQINTIMEKSGVVTETMLQAVTAILGCLPQKAQDIQRSNNLYLTFNAFDCVYFNGKWILNEPRNKRVELARELTNRLQKQNFKMVPVRSNINNKEGFYKSIIMEGGEGCVAKNLNGIYIPDTTRGKKGWIKIKRSVSEMASIYGDEFSLGDTIDGWISGFELGDPNKEFANLIGCFKVSVYVKRKDGSLYEHEIARISGIELKLRLDMTDVVEGIPTLKASYFGRIVEFDGANLSPRSMRFSHAVFKSFRYNKDKDDCVMDEDFLMKQIV